jgi:HAD superfamily hydrolase (TIGR01509 family)
MLKALIFDVDGTLADTEDLHRKAFNAAFAQAGLDWYWDVSTYTGLLDICGGKERILHYWKMQEPEVAGGELAQDVVKNLHQLKTRYYEEQISLGRLALRPGVQHLMEQALTSGLQLAIATTTTGSNVACLLQQALGGQWRSMFAAVCDGDLPLSKKPAPDVYLAALGKLNVSAKECVAFEDSANGLQAAHAAGIATVITPTVYTEKQQFDQAWEQVRHLDEMEIVARTSAENKTQYRVVRKQNHNTGRQQHEHYSPDYIDAILNRGTTSFPASRR